MSDTNMNQSPIPDHRSVERATEGEIGTSQTEFTGIGAELVGSMSEISEHVVKEHSPEKINDSSDLPINQKRNLENGNLGRDVSGPKDKFGRTFDERLHKSKDGEPSISKTGKLMLKPGAGGAEFKADTSNTGNKTRSTLYTPTGPEQPKDNTTTEEASQSAVTNYTALGRVAAAMFVTSACMLGGEDFRPQVNPKEGINELEHLETAFADYCRANEYNDISPNMALVVAVSSYVLPRFASPKVRERTSSVFGGIKNKLMGLFNKSARKGTVLDPDLNTDTQSDDTTNAA